MPLEQDVEDMEPVSSTGSETLDVSASADKTASEAEGADSSAATGATEEKDTLSVVRDVVDAASKAKTEAASQANGEDDGEDPDDLPPKKEEDDENFSDAPFNKHPRFRKLLQQRNEFKVDATRYRNFVGFIHGSGMSEQEAADGVQMLALIKTDPAGAFERARPFLQKWMLAAGVVVPDDLQRDVQAGKLSQEHAAMIARHRAGEESARARMAFDAQQREQMAVQARQQSLAQTANDWEADRRRRDPNFDAKIVPLQKEIAYLHLTEGKPTTPEGVRDQLKRAYKAVNTALPVAAAPQRKPATRPVMGGQVSGTARPEPTSTLDIIRANRAAR